MPNHGVNRSSRPAFCLKGGVLPFGETPPWQIYSAEPRTLIDRKENETPPETDLQNPLGYAILDAVGMNSLGKGCQVWTGGFWGSMKREALFRKNHIWGCTGFDGDEEAGSAGGCA